jgi:hypothetical protein
MTPTTLPLTALPRDTARPPAPTPTEDHEPRLSGGARYAFGEQMRPPARLQDPRPDRARSRLLRQLTSGGGGF